MSDSNSSPSPCMNFDYTPEFHQPESMYNELITNAGEFRLLQIEPADKSTTQIVARLFKASLDNPPQYEALSYPWEQTKGTHSIIVNKTKFPVMRNVFSFLLKLRRQSYPSSPIFWIDSVCINQMCIRDRNLQVHLMGTIYSKASVVHMWVGTESDIDQQAFDLIHHCGPPKERPARSVQATISNNEAGTKAITELLQRGYWNRMWVFQEIVLAKEAVVHCGKLQAPWSYFRWLDDVSSNHILWLALQLEKPWILDLRNALFRIAHFCITPAEAHHINNVIHPTRHLQCQDPRDKLYALRGVCGALEGMIDVDYSLPVQSIFTAFAKNQIFQDGNLSAMLTAGLWNPINGDDINLPSWVPDLRGMGDVDIRYLAAHYTRSFNADWTATLDNLNYYPTSSDFFDTDENCVFKVHAMTSASIQKHKPLKNITRSAPDRKELVKAFCVLTDDGRFCMRKLRELFEGLIFGDKTTLIENSPTVGQERAKRLVLGFYEDLCHLFGLDPVFVDFLVSFNADTPVYQRHESVHKLAQFCDAEYLHLCRMEYLARAEETTERQATVLFLTVDGHLGIGPRRVQQGDVAVIVRGCRVPLALRQHGTYHKLVGPAYVSGIMQGEAVRFGEDGEYVNFKPILLV